MEQDNKIRNDDELLEMFFDEHRITIADEGFSESVMRKFPQRAKRLNQIWSTICFAAAMGLFLLFDGIDEIRMIISNTIGDMVGYFVSIDFNNYSPILLLISVVILGMVEVYHLATIRG